jgi:hypothetical protein
LIGERFHIVIFLEHRTPAHRLSFGSRDSTIILTQLAWASRSKPAARQVEGDGFMSPHDVKNFIPKVRGVFSIRLAGFNG